MTIQMLNKGESAIIGKGDSPKDVVLEANTEMGEDGEAYIVFSPIRISDLHAAIGVSVAKNTGRKSVGASLVVSSGFLVSYRAPSPNAAVAGEAKTGLPAGSPVEIRLTPSQRGMWFSAEVCSVPATK